MQSFWQCNNALLPIYQIAVIAFNTLMMCALSRGSLSQRTGSLTHTRCALHVSMACSRDRYILFVVFFKTEEADEQARIADEEEQQALRRGVAPPTQYHRVSILLDSPAHVLQAQVHYMDYWPFARRTAFGCIGTRAN